MKHYQQYDSFFIEAALMTMDSMMIICFLRPYILLLFIALIPFSIGLYNYYWKSRRQLKRLESTSRSPVYDLIASTLNYLTFISMVRCKT